MCAHACMHECRFEDSELRFLSNPPQFLTKFLGYLERLKALGRRNAEGFKVGVERAKQIYENKIANKYNESLKKPNGNNALVNELECLTEALGPMRSHIKGVGRKLKSVTPDSFPNANRHEEDGRWLRQEKALEAMRQQNEPLKHQMNYLLKATKTQIPFSSHQLDEDDEEDEVSGMRYGISGQQGYDNKGNTQNH
ncbi:hypothetical protein R6Q59_028151 [Mikania micrantha]